MNFNFTYAPGTSLEQIIGFETAGRLWSSYLTDDVTVNLYIETTDSLATNVVGGALVGIQADESYETWRNKLAADRTTADDQLVYQNQQDDADKFTALIDGYKIDNNQELNVSRANAKALKMRGAQDGALDGYILMNKLSGDGPKWDYGVNNAVPSGTVDFFTVALHEIGHTLGFYSGVDKAGWLTQKTQYDASHQSDFYATLIGALDNATVLDMFRFSAQSVQAAGSGDSWIDLSVGGNPYLSLDGGKTALGYFSTGNNTSLGGDGDQASHWKHQSTVQGIMDPTLGSSERRVLAGLDQRAMDAIGWDLKPGGADLATLQAQSKQGVAQRLGVTVAWLEANPAEAAQRLAQDRSQDVQTMVEESEVYNWRRSSSGSTAGWWQEGLWQHMVWEEIESPSSDAAMSSDPGAIEQSAVSHSGNAILAGNGQGDDLIFDDSDFFLDDQGHEWVNEITSSSPLESADSFDSESLLELESDGIDLIGDGFVGGADWVNLQSNQQNDNQQNDILIGNNSPWQPLKQPDSDWSNLSENLAAEQNLGGLNQNQNIDQYNHSSELKPTSPLHSNSSDAIQGESHHF